jgi:hypothetical protein
MAYAFFPWRFLCTIEGQTPSPSTIDKCSTGPTSLYPPYIYCHCSKKKRSRSRANPNIFGAFGVYYVYEGYWRCRPIASFVLLSKPLSQWWHHAFHFLLDQTIVNMYIIYLGLCASIQYRRESMTHLQFKTQVCEVLLQGWRGCDQHVLVPICLGNRD